MFPMITVTVKITTLSYILTNKVRKLKGEGHQPGGNAHDDAHFLCEQPVIEKVVAHKNVPVIGVRFDHRLTLDAYKSAYLVICLLSK